MPPDSGWSLFFQVLIETGTLFVMLVGLIGLLVPVFPGLTVMWLATLLYALVEHARGHMTWVDWTLFALITLLMIVGNIVDNIIIAGKMRGREVPWSSIIVSYIVGIVASLFLTPIMGLLASPFALYGVEYLRVRDPKIAFEGTKAYMIGWGWSFAVRFGIGVGMTGLWMIWAWL